MKIIAIIPARGGSKSIPRKNIKLLNGKPLIAYSIKQAKDSEFIDRIIVSTEDEEETSFAINGVWDSFSKPTHLPQEYVLPGESVTVEFNLQANALPGENILKFKFLKYKGGGFEDSSFTVDFGIEKGSKELGEISSPDGYLNVRKCAGYNCEILTTVENGQIFIITDTQDAWKKIIYEEGEEGWVFIRYIKNL